MIRKIVLAFLIFSITPLALAKTSDKAYLGLGLSSNSPKGDWGDVLDDSIGFRGFVGTKINPNIAIEGGIILFGSMEDKFVSVVDVTTWGLNAGGVFSIPFNNTVSGYFTIGLLSWNSELSTPFETLEDNGIDVYFGAGINVALAPNLKLRGSLERFTLGGDVDMDISSLGAALIFSF